MWVTRKFVDDLVIKVAVLEAENRTLRDSNQTMKVVNDHARLRNTQLEKERAQMLHQFTGVKIAVPEYVPARESSPQQTINVDMFRDVGEDAAAEMGLGWDASGRMIDLPHRASANGV